MRLTSAIFALTSAVLFAACGGTQAGDDCNTNAFLCADQTTALECRLEKWRALPCRGPTGCTDDGEVTCDMSQSREGDACAASVEAHGVCDPTGTAVLTCRNGTLIKTNDCSRCSVVAGQISCEP